MELKNKIGATYQAPTTEVLDVIAEGVLCMSGEGSFNDLTRGDDIW